MTLAIRVSSFTCVHHQSVIIAAKAVARLCVQKVLGSILGISGRKGSQVAGDGRELSLQPRRAIFLVRELTEAANSNLDGSRVHQGSSSTQDPFK